MTDNDLIDSTDHAILGLLVQDGRRPGRSRAVRVNGVQHLRDVIDRLRRSGPVIGTKTLMVLGAWRRGG